MPGAPLHPAARLLRRIDEFEGLDGRPSVSVTRSPAATGSGAGGPQPTLDRRPARPDELLEGLNGPSARPSSTGAARCSWWPGRARARRGCSPGGSPISSPPATPPRGRSWPSPSPTRRPTRCAAGWSSLVGPVAERMWVSTFHAACVRILRAHADRLGYRKSFTIYDDTDSRRLVEHILPRPQHRRQEAPARSVQAAISAGQGRAAWARPTSWARPRSVFERRIGRCLRRVPAAACSPPRPWTSTTCCCRR